MPQPYRIVTRIECWSGDVLDHYTEDCEFSSDPVDYITKCHAIQSAAANGLLDVGEKLGGAAKEALSKMKKG